MLDLVASRQIVSAVNLGADQTRPERDASAKQAGAGATSVPMPKGHASYAKAAAFLVRAAAATLILTAVLKLSASGLSFVGRVDPSWSLPNPIIPILSERIMVLLVALSELGVACYLWRPPPDFAKCCIVLQLAAAFILYRFALGGIKTGRSCKCLGITSGPLLSLQDDASAILLALLVACGILGCGVCLLARNSTDLVPDPKTRSAQAL